MEDIAAENIRILSRRFECCELYGPKAHRLDTGKELCLLPSSGQLRTSGMKSRSQMSIQSSYKGIFFFKESTGRKPLGSRLCTGCTAAYAHTACQLQNGSPPLLFRPPVLVSIVCDTALSLSVGLSHWDWEGDW